MGLREHMARAMRPDFYDAHAWQIVDIEGERVKLLASIDRALVAMQDNLCISDGSLKVAIDHIRRSAPSVDQPVTLTLHVVEAFLKAALEGK